MSSNVLEKNQIVESGTATSKDDAIAEANAILEKAGAVTADYLEFMRERERLTSTYMGNFLAIPHGTNEGKDTILSSALSFVRYPDPDRLGRQSGALRRGNRGQGERAPRDPVEDRDHLQR